MKVIPRYDDRKGFIISAETHFENESLHKFGSKLFNIDRVSAVGDFAQFHFSETEPFNKGGILGINQPTTPQPT